MALIFEKGISRTNDKRLGNINNNSFAVYCIAKLFQGRCWQFESRKTMRILQQAFHHLGSCPKMITLNPIIDNTLSFLQFLNKYVKSQATTVRPV